MSEEEKIEHHVAFTLPVNLELAELVIIKATLNYFKGDKRAAAGALGISLKTVYNKLAQEKRNAKRKKRTTNGDRVPRSKVERARTKGSMEVATAVQEPRDHRSLERSVRSVEPVSREPGAGDGDPDLER